ncbi:hypothetical protein evm_011625 [Chilo suppressalis]|nr:hypothetical protein evm_011625 [Chilo suppressalis]
MAQSNNNQNQGLAPTTNRSVSIRADTTPSLALTQPPPLSFEGDLAKNFKTWLRQVELYMCANECHKKPSDTKAAILLHLLGEEGLDKFETFNLTEPEKSDYEKVLTALKEYCLPKTNETINRHIFFARNQKQGENFIYYLSEIKKLALTCNFGNLRDGLIRDKLINYKTITRGGYTKSNLIPTNNQKCLSVEAVDTNTLIVSVQHMEKCVAFVRNQTILQLFAEVNNGMLIKLKKSNKMKRNMKSYWVASILRTGRYRNR